MNYFSILVLTFLTFQSMKLFDFNTKSDISNWTIVDDVVMGGRSNGSFKLNEEGQGVFSGDVSLENNGGFSSLRYRFDAKRIKGANKIILKVKGDGKAYQFRMKTSKYDRHSYIVTFQTNKEWQTIEITLAAMYPVFRGSKLNIPNYPAEIVEELAFLIGNKKAESFQLEIDSIILE